MASSQPSGPRRGDRRTESPGSWPFAPPPAESPASAAREVGGDPRLELLRRAEALEIPWERILREEIQSEQAQRRQAPDVAAMPLRMRLSVLGSSCLASWRVRDEVQSLSAAARASAMPGPLRELRFLFRRLAGRADREGAALATHLWLAHQRVLALQRVCRAARRSRGTTAERMAAICASTRCSFDDAAWALAHETAPQPGHALDASVAKAREEGFQIPRAATEARSFAELRRIVRASARRLARPPAARAASVAVPHRVALRDGSI